MPAENLIRYDIGRSPHVVVASCTIKTSSMLTETAIFWMTVRDRRDHTDMRVAQRRHRDDTPDSRSPTIPVIQTTDMRHGNDFQTTVGGSDSECRLRLTPKLSKRYTEVDFDDPVKERPAKHLAARRRR